MTSSLEAPARRNPALRALALALYAAALFLLSRRITVFDDEATNIAVAARLGLRETVEAILAGQGPHQHPPLYDLLLGFWMQLVGESLAWVRIPSILFASAALAVVAATAVRLGGRWWVAFAVGALWPTGLFLGATAHWSSLAMLVMALATWTYVGWTQEHRASWAAGFAAAALGVVYTNYLGWVLLGALALHFVLSRPPRAEWRRGLLVVALVTIGSAPLIWDFVSTVEGGLRLQPSLFALALSTGYNAYALVASETVAPWTLPGVGVALGLVGVLAATLRVRRVWPFVIGLALVFVPAAGLGLLTPKRLGLFAPWLLLWLGLLVTDARVRRIAVPSLALVFGLAWLGFATERWVASFRYVEPWDEIVAQVADWSQPGDLVVCTHPSFYAYAHDRFGWSEWYYPFEEGGRVIERDGRFYVALPGWKRAVPRHARVIFVRSSVVSQMLVEEARLLSHLERHYRLVNEARFLRDDAGALKQRFLPNQRIWRVELLAFERGRR